MGLSSSQVRFLALTSRKHDVQNMMNRLTRQKLDLTRETQKISKEYNNALNTKTLKWSNNSGVTYTDITYSGLMRPGEMNNYSPYLITDSKDRVVLDSSYAEYAKSIDQDGYSGDNRYALLAKATGVDAETIKKAEQAELRTETLAGKYEATQLAAEKALSKVEKSASASKWATDLAKEVIDQVKTKDGKPSVSSSNAQADLINQLKYGYTHVDDEDELTDFASALINVMDKYLPYSTDEIKEKVKTALMDTSGLWKELDTWAQNLSNTDSSYCGFTYDASESTITFDNPEELMEKILINMGLSVGDDEYYYCNFAEEGSTKGITKSEYFSLLDDVDTAQAEYYDQQSSTNTILTSEQEKKIQFYDSLFMAIAEKAGQKMDKFQIVII